MPILKVGGRGEAGYTISVPVTFGNSWSITAAIVSGDTWYTYFPTQGYNQSWMDPYGPGGMEANVQHYGAISVKSCPGIPQISLVTLAFVQPDGTKTDLVDQATGGAVEYRGCSLPSPSRGTVFQSRDIIRTPTP